MSNRLQLFRQRMAAFEGAADPVEAIESGYYVHSPELLLVDRITTRIALRPSSSHLLIGGIGSGKTTQLLVIRDEINQIEDTQAIYVDVSLHTDISKISNGVLTAIIGLELAHIVEDTEDEDIQKYIQLVRNLAHGYEERRLQSVSRVRPKFIQVKHEGIISKSEKYNISAELIEAVNVLAKYAQYKCNNIIFLLDGLDRLNNSETFIQILNSDTAAISSAGIGLVVVGPLIAFYSLVDSFLDYFYYHPFLDVSNDLEAYSFFENIIRTRSSNEFIEEESIQELIYYSGGVLRDLISLTQAAIEETYLLGDDTVQPEHVLKAVDSFSTGKILGVSDDEIKILKQTMNTEKFIPRTDEDLKLLVKGLILEYKSPQKRYVVHPTINTLIQQISV